MSRRHNENRRSPLDEAFDERGLVRLGQAARELGIAPSAFKSHGRANANILVDFEWGHGVVTGVRRKVLDELKMRATRRRDI